MGHQDASVESLGNQISGRASTEGGKRGILLIHGFAGSYLEFLPYLIFLRRIGYRRIYPFRYPQCLGTVPFAAIARRLAGYCERRIPAGEELVAIGFSQGGMIAGWWLEFLGGKRRCRTCITICSPLHGTAGAWLTGLPGFIDLRPGSRFLADLAGAMAASGVAYCGVWSPLDCVVIPGISARAPWQRKSRRLLVPFHFTAYWSPATLAFVREVLAETGGGIPLRPDRADRRTLFPS